MFSLNSINTQNQILVTFSQLSARYSTFTQRKHRHSKDKNLKRNGVNKTYDATFCKESSLECLKNFDKNVIAEMKNVDLRQITAVSTSLKPSNSAISVPSSKKVSYISGETFQVNKNGWSTTPTVTVNLQRQHWFSFTDNFVGLLTNGVRGDLVNFNVQVRGFKTDRGVSADSKRNPNLLDRLRKFLG